MIFHRRDEDTIMLDDTITVIENNHEPQLMKVEEFPPEMQKMPKAVYKDGKQIGEEPADVREIRIYSYDENGELTDDKTRAVRIEIEYYDEEGDILTNQTMIPAH